MYDSTRMLGCEIENLVSPGLCAHLWKDKVKDGESYRRCTREEITRLDVPDSKHVRYRVIEYESERRNQVSNQIDLVDSNEDYVSTCPRS